MQQAQFSVYCPYQIGDEVSIMGSGKTYKVTDIKCVHYLKSGTIEVYIELDGKGYCQVNPQEVSGASKAMY